MWHPERVLENLRGHRDAPGFFTLVAACSVLGSQSLLIGNTLPITVALAIFGLVGWIVFTYTIFTVFAGKQDKPGLENGINGGWLLAVVATQAMSVIASLIAAEVTAPALRLELNFFALSLWPWGGMLYIWMMALMFYQIGSA